MIEKTNTIHGIIIVVSLHGRYDAHTLSTIRFFHSLLEPVFKNGSVFLAIPNFGERRVEEMMDDLEELEELEDEIKKKTDIWKRECEVLFSFFKFFVPFSPDLGFQ